MLSLLSIKPVFNSVRSFKMELMCFTFEKNNKQSKKPINCFLQDGAIAIGIVIKCRFYTEDEFNRR